MICQLQDTRDCVSISWIVTLAAWTPAPVYNFILLSSTFWSLSGRGILRLVSHENTGLWVDLLPLIPAQGLWAEGSHEEAVA